MPVKKRRLSPSASSASSTPAPSSAPPSTTVNTSTLPSSLAGPTEGLAGPGPSTLSHSQSRRERNDAAERREYAVLGAKQPGSGDGEEFGEECFLWTDIPIVKNFRYSPCAISPTPSPHPRYPFHRTIPYPPSLPPVHISWLDRSSYIRVSPSGLSISNDRGFRSARANVAVREGTWYFEVKIEKGNGSLGGGKGHLISGDAGNAHVRVGWGRREANIDAPVGSDAYSYGIRDVNGEKITISRPKAYSSKPFQTGDIVGCLIHLPSRPATDNLPRSDPGRIKRTRRQFIYKNQSYFESAEYMPSKEMDSLIDREGKAIAEKKAAEKKAAELALNPDYVSLEEQVNGNGSIPKKGGAKKGATTKNTKKKKEDTSLTENVSVLRPLRILEGSRVEFFINGISAGPAFDDLYDFTPLPPVSFDGKKINEDEIVHDDGTLGYYPMISCFGKGKAKFNPGPEFAFPPDQLGKNDRTSSNGDGNTIGPIRPICERWEEFRTEEKTYDELDEIEGTEKLKEVLEEEEKIKLKASLQGNSAKRKKGPGAPMKKKKVDITDSIRGDSMSRAGTMTPAPDVVIIGIDEDLIKEERERSVSIAPSLGHSFSVPPTRGSSPISNKIYQEIAEQDNPVEDTPQSPATLEDHRMKEEDGDVIETRSVNGVNEGHESQKEGEKEEENADVQW
ncbi:uncharacterized protein I206_104464 [Kwoniella pini CBS 10737]|uniref:B30.2/SPRY domain-containing protein n=1 Tax=Kwoniella pini CBS 10737 TaxID=1296096 RepID=A0A1B9I1N0_9TREE|nr:uncharacterized protein I206_03955 [Kwoniella pini CBS 10737]OCF49434.1 hypothetical protein I206_03955 [Kwoniella pini CBS 10737]